MVHVETNMDLYHRAAPSHHLALRSRSSLPVVSHSTDVRLGEDETAPMKMKPGRLQGKRFWNGTDSPVRHPLVMRESDAISHNE